MFLLLFGDENYSKHTHYSRTHTSHPYTPIQTHTHTHKHPYAQTISGCCYLTSCWCWCVSCWSTGSSTPSSPSSMRSHSTFVTCYLTPLLISCSPSHHYLLITPIHHCYFHHCSFHYCFFYPCFFHIFQTYLLHLQVYREYSLSLACDTVSSRNARVPLCSLFETYFILPLFSVFFPLSIFLSFFLLFFLSFFSFFFSLFFILFFLLPSIISPSSFSLTHSLLHPPHAYTGGIRPLGRGVSQDGLHSSSSGSPHLSSPLPVSHHNHSLPRLPRLPFLHMVPQLRIIFSTSFFYYSFF